MAHAVFLLVSISHTSLLVEPMLVFGAGRFRRVFPRYVRALLEVQGLATLALVAVALLATGGARAMGHSTAWTILALGAVLSFSAILLQWLLRRACYVRGRSALAAAASAVYAGVVGIGILALRGIEALSPYTAFGIMAVAAAVSAVVPLVGLGIGRGPRPSRRLRWLVRCRHSRFGRWTLLTNGLSWIPYNAFTLVLTAASGLQATATFRALFNLIMPMQHASAALSLVLLPALVRRRGSAASALARRAAIGFATSAIAFAAILIAVRVPLVDFLYGGRYVSDADLLWGLAILPIMGALNVAWRARLLADERPEAVFRAFAIGAGVTLFGGIPLVLWSGLSGAVIGRVAAAVAISWTLWRVQRTYHSRSLLKNYDGPRTGSYAVQPRREDEGVAIATSRRSNDGSTA